MATVVICDSSSEDDAVDDEVDKPVRYEVLDVFGDTESPVDDDHAIENITIDDNDDEDAIQIVEEDLSPPEVTIDLTAEDSNITDKTQNDGARRDSQHKNITKNAEPVTARKTTRPEYRPRKAKGQCDSLQDVIVNGHTVEDSLKPVQRGPSREDETSTDSLQEEDFRWFMNPQDLEILPTVSAVKNGEWVGDTNRILVDKGEPIRYKHLDDTLEVPLSNGVSGRSSSQNRCSAALEKFSAEAFSETEEPIRYISLDDTPEKVSSKTISSMGILPCYVELCMGIWQSGKQIPCPRKKKRRSPGVKPCYVILCQLGKCSLNCTVPQLTALASKASHRQDSEIYQALKLNRLKGKGVATKRSRMKNLQSSKKSTCMRHNECGSKVNANSLLRQPENGIAFSNERQLIDLESEATSQCMTKGRALS